MVHCSQVSEELSLSRDDEDDAKVKAMEFFCPPASEVRHCIMLFMLYLLLAWVSCYFSLWQVWVKVSEIREEGGGAFKVACSMKVRHVLCTSRYSFLQLHIYKQELMQTRCISYVTWRTVNHKASGYSLQQYSKLMCFSWQSEIPTLHCPAHSFTQGQFAAV